MELTTDRLRLRPWEDSDAARLYELAKDRSCRWLARP